MQHADFEALADAARKDRKGSSYAEGMHPNPRYYKYYWWVFHKNSPCDGRAFHSDRYRLAIHEANKLIDKLRAEGETYWLYNTRIPRKDPQNPWDPESPAWNTQEWAVAYDDDPDPEWNGHK